MNDHLTALGPPLTCILEGIINGIIPLLVGILIGYLSSVIQRRFKATEIVCDLLLKEIKQVSELHDNICGDSSISGWFEPSKKRIKSYRLLVDWNEYSGGSKVINKFEDLNTKVVGIRYKRENILEDLCQLYKLIKKTI